MGKTKTRLYRCDWPNGDVSFVLARTPEDAVWALDEVDGASEEMLTEVDTFQVHFVLKRGKRDPQADSAHASKWKFAFQSFGEQTNEYMDVDAAVRRKSALKSSSTLEPQKQHGHVVGEKPLLSMSEIEYRNAWDRIQRGPSSLLGGMLDEARKGPSAEYVRTAVVVLVLPNGEERFLYGSSEYGDDEGRNSAASCWRYCSMLTTLAPGERLERLRLETRLADLRTTRGIDPVGDDEGHDWLELDEEDRANEGDRVERSRARWADSVAEARHESRKMLVSVGVLMTCARAGWLMAF